MLFKLEKVNDISQVFLSNPCSSSESSDPGIGFFRDVVGSCDPRIGQFFLTLTPEEIFPRLVGRQRLRQRPSFVFVLSGTWFELSSSVPEKNGRVSAKEYFTIFFSPKIPS